MPSSNRIVLDTNYKFVDCAFAANATFIVSDDKHFDVLKEIPFPRLLVLKLIEFLSLLKAEDNSNNV